MAKGKAISAFDAEMINLKNTNGRLQAELEKHRWIPVSERLPENTTDILLLYPDGDIFMGYYNGKWYPYQVPACNDQVVIHWKPIILPKSS